MCAPQPCVYIATGDFVDPMMGNGLDLTQYHLCLEGVAALLLELQRDCLTPQRTKQIAIARAQIVTLLAKDPCYEASAVSCERVGASS